MRGGGPPDTRFERQRDHVEPGSALDRSEHLLQPPDPRRRRHEPQIEAMLALVVVVDLGKPRDELRDRIQALGRHLHGRERRSTDRVRPKDRADAADGTEAAQGRQRLEDLVALDSDPVRDEVIGLGYQRELALEIVQQAELERIHRFTGRSCASAR
jgi:hypothetical protein